MNAKDYQEQAARTINRLDVDASKQQMQAINFTLGMAGEAGEAANIIKKIVFHGHEDKYPALMEEVGDVLWYCAALCEIMGWDLGVVMEFSIQKLQARYPNGFTAEDSRHRSAGGKETR